MGNKGKTTGGSGFGGGGRGENLCCGGKNVSIFWGAMKSRGLRVCFKSLVVSFGEYLWQIMQSGCSTKVDPISCTLEDSTDLFTVCSSSFPSNSNFHFILQTGSKLPFGPGFAESVLSAKTC